MQGSSGASEWHWVCPTSEPSGKFSKNEDQIRSHLLWLPGTTIKKTGSTKPGRPRRKAAATAKPITSPHPECSGSSEEVKAGQDDDNDEEWKVTAAEPDDQHEARHEVDSKKRKHVSFAEPLSSAAPGEAKQSRPGVQDSNAKPPASAKGAHLLGFLLAIRKGQPDTSLVDMTVHALAHTNH